VSPAGSAPAVFERIVCGLDETPQSLDAVRQAARLRSPTGRLHVLTAVHLGSAAATGWSATRVSNELQQEAEDALGRALELSGEGATSRLVDGPPARSLLSELDREQATLLSVGSHSHHRLPGIVLGHVATTILHEAPCSVLVARPPKNSETFPRSIVVGIDGSPQSEAAYAVALQLAARFDASLTPLAAYGGKYIDTDALGRAVPDLDLDHRHAVEALVAAAAHADLLVVGSRGLHGLRALGSVSERVAHRAACSVLVIREPSGR
jgi:nucleotide-binding universal stress UspA family protein